MFTKFNLWTTGLTAMFALDLRALALMRIGLGLVSLYNVFTLIPVRNVFFGSEAIVPLSALDAGPTIFALSVDDRFVALVLGAHALLALMLIVGLHTRWVVIGCLLLSISEHNRLHLITFGGDMVLRILLLWSCFLPLAARFSWDRARGKYHQYTANQYVSTATVCFILQWILGYTLTGFLKSHATWTQEYSAMSWIFQTKQFATPLATALVQYENWLRGLTCIVLLIERFGTFFLLAPFPSGFLRVAVILTFVALHVGIALTLKVSWFSAVMIAGWVAFLPGPIMDRFARSRREGMMVDPRGKAVIAIFLYVLFMNAFYLSGNSQFKKRFGSAYEVGRTMGWFQNWGMFAPKPLPSQEFFYALSHVLDPDKEGHKLIHIDISHHRWYKLMSSLNRGNNGKYVHYLRRYLRKIHLQRDPNINFVEIFSRYQVFRNGRLGPVSWKRL